MNLPERLPEILAREHVQQAFFMSERGARELMRTLPSFTIGKRRFVLRATLLRHLECLEREETSR